ncbi:MAG: bifunctional sugar-1-phosphate nucleotidylyltransferase/acetyltransferase [Archaeoglobaceae archaeon]
MQAVILAAGEGQRLWPFTANKPKVMIRVAGKPILEYVVNALKDTGIFDIVMVVGYRKERIKDYFEDGSDFGVDITYVEQNKQLGTAHALKQAEKHVKDSFVVLPGDNIVDSRTIQHATSPTTLVYKRMKTRLSKYGSVIIDDGQVSGVVEKAEQAVSNLANIGIYCLDNSIFDHIGEEISLIPVINDMAHQAAIKGVETDGVWMDVVYPWDILKVNDMAMDFSGKTIAGKLEANVNIIGDVKIGKNTIIRGNSYITGPVVIGEGCEIGPNTVIMPSTSIGNNVTTGASYIANSVINSNTILKAGCFVNDSVIDNGCVIEANFTTNSGQAEIKIGEELHEIEAGLFMGENCTVGPNVVAEAGTIVGNKSTISAMKLLRGKIPDGSMVL